MASAGEIDDKKSIRFKMARKMKNASKKRDPDEKQTAERFMKIGQKKDMNCRG